MRPARRRAVVVLSAALVLAGLPLSFVAGAAVTASAPSTYGPVYEVHGSILAPTSVARGVRCPDPVTKGTTTYDIVGVTPGRVFSLTADDATYRNDFDVRFFASAGDCAAGTSPLHHLNHAGDEHAVVPANAAVGVVTLAIGGPASFTYAELPPSPLRPKRGHRAVTVVAVVEPAEGFAVYHEDFLGSKHPWNTDGDPSNDIDFTKPPSSFIPGMPPQTAVQLTLPTSGDQRLADLRAADEQTLKGMRSSDGDEPNLYWFPGTKVVAAAHFGGSGSDASELVANRAQTHPTHTASVAAGNVHGTCPECVFVLLRGTDVSNNISAVEWAAKQPWIDVVTNSWGVINRVEGHPSYSRPGNGKVAIEDGQTIVWSAGNGIKNTMTDVPNFTWSNGQRGPDWIVTVGAVTTTNDGVPRSGWPVDIAAYGNHNPSAGGETVNSETTFAGTSAAAPIVAGTFAKVIQLGRLALGDEVPGHAGGVVAEGKPVRCVLPAAPCPLGDGVLERAEVQQLVFDNVLPSTKDVSPDFSEVNAPVLPPAEDPPDPYAVGYWTGAIPPDFTPATQGHGIVYGRFDPDRFVAEQRRLADALAGAVVPYVRPAGERAWMIADSHCRQQGWGTWNSGYYTGQAPPVVHPLDTVGAAADAGCAQLPSEFWERIPTSQV